MKTHHPKLKTPPLPLSSCPTTPNHSPLSLLQSDPPPPPPPLPPPSNPPPEPDSSSSFSSTSQSFTQWRFPLPNSPILHHQDPPPPPESDPTHEPPPLSDPPPPLLSTNLQELYHLSELQLSTGSDSDRLAALHLLERPFIPNPQPDPVCPPEFMRGVVRYLKDRAGAKPATKILLALCLGEFNRHVAVAVGEVIEALAALELMCTVAEGRRW